MKQPTNEQLNDPKWWNERAGSASHYCPTNLQFYDARLHPCCISRPIPVSTSWRGPEDGNPPPGTKCKMALNADNFVDVRISTYTEKSVVIERLDTGREECISREAKWEFRPIQSERERLLKMAVESLSGLSDTFVTDAIEDLAGQLFDAGMLVDPDKKLMGRTEAFGLLRMETELTDGAINSLLNSLGYKEE